MDPKRVGVIFGSRSVEHDVSIVTAHQIMEVLEKSHELVPIYITKDGAWVTGPELNDMAVFTENRWLEVSRDAYLSPVPGTGLIVPRLGLKGQLTIPLDIVVPAVHGTFGEDGTLQGLLELANIPYTGSGVTASAVGMDKVVMRSVFKSNGLPVVDALIVEGLDEITYDLPSGRGNGQDTDAKRMEALRRTFQESIDDVDAQVRETMGYPVFVKPVSAGSSVGIAKATDRESLQLALEVAANYDSRVLIERSMEGCIEVNCSVLGGDGFEPRVSLCEQPIAWTEFLSFEDKYMRGGKSEGSATKEAGMASLDRRIPAPIADELTKQVQENALEAFRAIGAAGVARVDAFVKEDTGETWVGEINTMPGSFAFYLWENSGMSFAQLTDNLLAIAFETHRRKSRLMYTFESSMLEGRGSKT
jgi:D-alanine-D-alanine ligase